MTDWIKRKFIATNNGYKKIEEAELNSKIVKKQLLTIQEVTTVLSENESTLKELLAKANVKQYHVGNRELIERAELDNYLSKDLTLARSSRWSFGTVMRSPHPS